MGGACSMNGKEEECITIIRGKATARKTKTLVGG
jgi:hypothetical protein